MNIHSYSKVYNLGHPAVKNLLNGLVVVEEKIDGSQISFGVDTSGGLHIRSKGAVIYPEAPDNMFAAGVEEIKRLANLLRPGWVYRGEYLQKPKHNTLNYTRVPARHIIIFDIESSLYEFLRFEPKFAEAHRLGLECVPLLYFGGLSLEKVRELLETESCLGGVKVEGVVIKPMNYDVWDTDKKALMGKFVSEEFKETHRKERARGPKDIIAKLAEVYTTQARWQKAVQTLRDVGVLEGAPKDIGGLIKQVLIDVEEECADEIMVALWVWAWPQLKRKIVWGLPEWYKKRLLEAQFDENSESCE